MEKLMICEVCGTKMRYMYTKRIGEHMKSLFYCPKCETSIIKRDIITTDGVKRRFI